MAKRSASEMTNEEKFKMVIECVSHFEVVHNADDSITITIEVPHRFADLWIVKVNSLTATEQEIADYEPPAE
jgi:hypothetical protein